MRSRLLLPIETVSVHLQLLATPFINKSLQLGRLSAATEQQQAELDLYVFYLFLFPLSLFTAFSFSNFPLLLSAQLPLTEPSLLSLSDSLLLQPQQGRATDSLLCVNLSVKRCVCVHMCPLGTLLFKLTALFGSGRQAFFF